MSTKPHAKAMRLLARRCPTLKQLIARVGPCTWAPAQDDPFTLIVRCIISQQISGKAAESITARLVQVAGGSPISPKRLAKLTDDQYQACGVSGPKRRTFQAICEHVKANPDFLAGIDSREDDELREQLVSIKGIGPWTVDMFLMFSSNRPDILPIGDSGLKAGVRNLFGLKELPSGKELERIAEPWRPHRSIATWYVWRSLEPKFRTVAPVADAR